MGRALETGKLVAPEDGPVSWTAHADLAEAAVIALTDEGRLQGITPALTGSEALDLAAIAAIASELTARPITRVTVSDSAGGIGTMLLVARQTGLAILVSSAAMLSRRASCSQLELWLSLMSARSVVKGGDKTPRDKHIAAGFSGFRHRVLCSPGRHRA